MDYELRIVVEKVAVSSQEVVTRDTIASYALQCPTSIVELGLRHGEQIDLLAQVQNIVLAEQSDLLDLGTPVCPACGNTLKKNGYKASYFRAVFSDHTVRIQKHCCNHPACGWQRTPTVTSLFGTNIHPDLATRSCPRTVERFLSLAYLGHKTPAMAKTCGASGGKTVDDLTRFCCHNQDCRDQGQRGADNLTVCMRYGKHRHVRLLYCRSCQARVAERQGTPRFGAKLETAKMGLQALSAENLR
jgi:hypothetical protein